MSRKELFGVVVFGCYKGKRAAVHTADADLELITDIQSQQLERQP
jgi:hypothetical protein